MATKTLPISDAREQLTILVERVARLRSQYIITRKGEPNAVLMSHAEYESWLETLDLLQDADEVAGIREGLAELQRGRSVTFEETFGEALNGRTATATAKAR